MTRPGDRRSDLVLDVIEDWQAAFGHPPSVRQLMERVGLTSTAAVHHHLRKLVAAERIVECQCGCGRYRLVAV